LSAKPPLEIFRWYTKSGYPPKVAPVYDSHADPLERAMGTHKIQGDRFCFDKETEVLTKQGWVLVVDVTLNHEVATRNPITGSLEYHKPEGTSLFTTRGPLIRVGGDKSSRYDLLVTPEHQLLLKNTRGEEEIHSAKELLDLAGHETSKKMQYSLLVGLKGVRLHGIPLRTRWERIQVGDVHWEPYVGGVYCLTVKNHTVLVRRHGRITWCGNTGKSSLGEVICYLYLITGATIYDIYGANDNEPLAILDSEWVDHVTLVTGSNCTLKFNLREYKQIRAIDLEPRLQGPQNIFVAAKAFFQTEDDYYRAMWALSERFKQRLSYDRVDVIFMREAQEVITGVMRAGVARSEKDAMAAFIKFHNNLFHFGFAVVLDSQRDVEISKSVRELADWNYFKNMGGMEIPRRFWHTFSKVHPDRVYRSLEPWQFVIYCKGKVGLGRFQMPPWHIERGKDILTRLGIKPEFSGSPSEEFLPASQGGTGAGRPKDVRLRAKIWEMRQAGASYSEIMEKLHTSNKTITRVVVAHRTEEERKNLASANPT